MKDINARNFGIIIAYLVPGFVALCGLGISSSFVRAWLLGASLQGPTVGGFLYVLLASIAAGMTLGAVRWAILDSIHHATGIVRPIWNDAALEKKLNAFQYLVENHYRYYQFYGHMLIAVLFSYLVWRTTILAIDSNVFMFDSAAALILGVFVAGSRNTLRRYYQRTSVLLGTKERKESNDQRESPDTDEGEANEHPYEENR